MLPMTPELRKACYSCLLASIAFLAPLRASGGSLQPLACSMIQSEMGPFFRWPTVNQGMVAPVLMVWNYPVYRSPLRTAFTGKSIQIDIPASFGQTAGFHLGKTAIPTKTDERFRLTRIDIRKPAQAYTGLGQALSHVMEMVLIHREEKGDKWANVILPFQVSTNGADMDIINPIIDGVHLPSRISQTGYVMASAASEMKLSPGFENATFSEFWNTAPAAGCTKKILNVRYFMRTNTLAIGIDTFAQLSNALENVPAQEPVQPPETTWLMDTCRNNSGVCTIQKPVDMQAKLQNLKTYQSQAIKEQRARKADLDKKLNELTKHKGPATKQSIALYEGAVAAYNDLKSAASELLSSESHVAKVQTFATEAAKWPQSKFDQDGPKPANAAASTPQLTTTQKPAALVDLGVQNEQRNDCSALGQSPVDIDTNRVLDPSTSALALVQPLAFRYMTLADGGRNMARLQLTHLRHHLRVAVPPGSVEWPLGGVLSGGVLRGVSYVDIHVPGEHTVDGHVPAAELQLVHESAGGKPAMAVAIPLELSDGSLVTGIDKENEWLKPLLEALPEKNTAREVLGQPLGLLHSDLSSGATTSYLRYDGSLTKPPCLLTQWFVLEQPGHLSRQQLADLATALGVDASSRGAMQHGPTFMTSLVMRGSPNLIGQVTGASESSDTRPIKLRVRRRMQI